MPSQMQVNGQPSYTSVLRCPGVSCICLLQVSPGFFDAPSAAMVQLPGRLANESQPPPLTIAFCNCCTFKVISLLTVPITPLKPPSQSPDVYCPLRVLLC